MLSQIERQLEEWVESQVTCLDEKKCASIIAMIIQFHSCTLLMLCVPSSIFAVFARTPTLAMMPAVVFGSTPGKC